MSDTTSIRIGEMSLPARKPLWLALTYIEGIGKTTANKICDSVSGKIELNKNQRLSSISDEQKVAIRDEINHLVTEGSIIIEGNLRRQISENVERLKHIRSRRGQRLAKGLSLHGRTKTNGKTSHKKLWDKIKNTR